ncbi:sensor histidine kinase [Clostridium thailandense]|uniref:sensor histidine kinase n=1 Tax=Clostridium thailandense TaxID=2794346 RepID=UPI003989BE52
MEELHKLLKRQIKKYLNTNEIPENLIPFLMAVNEAYKHNDEDRFITERAMELSSAELSEMIHKVKEAQMELVYKEKMASIGQLAAGIAHEINNPLGYIISNMETLNKYIEKYENYLLIVNKIKELSQENFLKEYSVLVNEINSFEKVNKVDFINEDMKEIIVDSLEGLSRIAKIVLGLRDFSRINVKDSFTNYDLNEGIENTLIIANNSIKYIADIKLELSKLPNIQALGNEINQVILNILINAVHAIKDTKRKGIICIRTYEKEDHVVLEIEDNGVGISDEVLLKIFDPFFTTKPVGEGTGLGLSISYDIIVNKHKGKIDVRSDADKGSTFVIQLPIHPS